MSIKSRKHAPLPRNSPLARSAVAFAVGLALGLPAAANAADADDQQTKTLGKIEVQDTVEEYTSSSKFTQPLQDIPQTIQVIPKELFNQQGATTLTEALRNSAGVGTFYAGENGSTSTGDAVYMRGFDTSGSIFVDGIRDLGSISRDVFNIDSIEVEKGPAGTDNGRSAPTGAINTVTKQPFLQDSRYVGASLGVDGQKRATADWNQTISALPGSAARLNAMWQDSDVVGRDHVNNKRWGLAPSLAYGLDGLTRVYFDLLYVKQNNIPDGFVPTIGLPRWSPQPGLAQLVGHPVDPSNFYGTRDDHDDATAKMATLRFEHDFSSNLKLTNTARWGLTKQDYLLTSFTVTSAVTALGVPTGNVKWTNVNDLSTYTLARSNTNYKDQANKILTDQLSLRYDFNTGFIEHNLSTGLEVTREQQFAHTLVGTGTRPVANLYDPNWNDAGVLVVARNGAGSNGQTDTNSIYAFDTLKFGEHFMVTGGLRADHYDTDYSTRAACNTSTGTAAIPCNGAAVGTIVPTTPLEAKDTLLNWKIGAVYKPLQPLSLYVNYALSQQPPGGANFTLSTATNNANNPNLDPQKARTIELGSKWSVLDEKAALNVALFQTKVTNEINSQILDDNGNPTQTGEKSVKGIELSFAGNITRNWLASVGYSHLDTKVSVGPLTAQDGTPNLTYTPGDSFTSWTSYNFPFGLTLGGGLRFVDGLHRGTDGAVGTPSTTGGYGVVDAVASYAATEKLSLRLNAYNIADKQYVAAINKSGYRYTPGTPRTFLLSADYRF